MSIKKSYKHSKKQIIEAIESARGLVSLAADRLGLTTQAVHDRIRKDPDIAAALQNARNRQIDITEAKLFQAVNEGEIAAIIFYLKTQGKQRGYVERQEMGGALNITIEHVQQPLPED